MTKNACLAKEHYITSWSWTELLEKVRILDMHDVGVQSMNSLKVLLTMLSQWGQSVNSLSTIIDAFSIETSSSGCIGVTPSAPEPRSSLCYARLPTPSPSTLEGPAITPSLDYAAVSFPSPYSSMPSWLISATTSRIQSSWTAETHLAYGFVVYTYSLDIIASTFVLVLALFREAVLW